jgi:hypothetical protein
MYIALILRLESIRYCRCVKTLLNIPQTSKSSLILLLLLSVHKNYILISVQTSTTKDRILPQEPQRHCKGVKRKSTFGVPNTCETVDKLISRTGKECTCLFIYRLNTSFRLNSVDINVFIYVPLCGRMLEFWVAILDQFEDVILISK